jgi:Zn-dependent M16 (insulinase) family peptidase
MGGVNYLFFLRQLEKQIDNDWPGVVAQLEAVRHALVNRNSLIANVTLDAANWQRFEPLLDEFVAALPAAPFTSAAWTPIFDESNEGLTIPAQVNYVAKGANLYNLGYQHHGSINVITNFIRTSWLWEKVRMQGGAYGAGCGFSKLSGVFTFTSYRDPNLTNTLDVYDQTAELLRTVDLSDDELTKNVIGAIGAMDAYQLPDAKGYTSMMRHLLGESDADRQRTRDEILGTTIKEFRQFGDVLAELNKQGRVVVMGSPGAISAANAGHGNWLKVQKVL